MLNKVKILIRDHYLKIINSIAFYPAFIGIIFLVASMLLISFDSSEAGKQIKLKLHWLSLKDASTARSIIAAITAGIISLTVFSFSMVMIVLNQAASQMSNRVLDKLIGNRFQQIVLGIYIGTIVYALFLLSTIRDVNSGIYVPALSTYLLIIITVIDIFIFIYFLHYITQSVKYEVIIQRIFKETKVSLEKYCCLQTEPSVTIPTDYNHEIYAAKSGVYEGFDKKALTKLCVENNCSLHIRHTSGTFILKGISIIKVNKQLPVEVSDLIQDTIYIHTTESIEDNFYYGFRQLMEIAIKALSPGINDPGTAVVCLRALFQLLCYRASNFPDNIIQNTEKKTMIIKKELTFDKIFADTVLPIWDYGNNDRMIQDAMEKMLTQLQALAYTPIAARLLQEVTLKRSHTQEGL